MGSSRVVVRKKAAQHARVPRPAAPAPSHALLQLQRQAGNRAVSRLIQGSAGHAVPAAALLPVQRDGGVALSPPPLLSERQRLASQAAPVVKQVVGGLPEELGRQGIDESQAEEARREAEDMTQEAPEFVPDDASFAAWLNAQQGGGGGPQLERQRSQFAELEAGRDAAAEASSEGTFAPEIFGETEPKPAQPGRLARAGRAVKGFFRGAGTSIKGGLSGAGNAITGGLSRAGRSLKGGFSQAGSAITGYFSRNDVRDKGKNRIAMGGAIASTGAHLDNPLTERTAGVYGGQSATDWVKEAGHQGTPATLEHPSDFARTFTSGAGELLHAVAGLVGIFFSGLKAAVDLKSLVSSVRVVQALKRAKAQAKEQAESLFDPESAQDAQAIVEMVEYAIRQKYKKIIKRAITAAVALATVGTALAVLIANPVGASVAGLAIGAVSLSMLVYKLGRGAWKKWKTKDKGQKRAAMAYKLYVQVRDRNQLAEDAVRALHLDPAVVRRDKRGIGLIERKLKSA